MTYIISMQEQARTILYALENDVFSVPNGDSLVCGGYDMGLSLRLKTADFMTPFAEDAALWAKSGHRQVEENKKYAIAYVLAEQQKEARHVQIGLALKYLQEEGLIVVCAENSQGGKTLLNLQDVFYIKLNTISKHKCRLVWGVKGTHEQMLVAYTNALQAGAIRLRPDGLWTQPGVFSWEHSDIGSRLLTQYIPPLKGRIADFGCGIGEIAAFVLNQSNNIQTATLIDHDARAIACAHKNLSAYSSLIEYIWSDIRDIALQNQFDVIVMNPPFHKGKAQSVDLGKIFISRAHQALKRGGRLYMVANTHLPYESLLSELFVSYNELGRKDGFKVITAHK